MRVKDKLQDLELRPRKTRGQNFLIDKSVITEILDFAALRSGEKIIEIGPGLGALTGELYALGDLSVIEIEAKLCDELRLRFPKLNIINQDILKSDLSSFGENLLIFGNIPYSLSSDIVFHLIEHRQNINRAVLMVQHEFGKRLCAESNCKDYGVLSVNAQMFCDMRLGAIVPGDSFHPATRVNSVLVEFRFLKHARYDIGDEKFFKRVVFGAFNQRRKMLKNSLENSGLIAKDQAEIILEQLGLDAKIRAEKLNLRNFAELANLIAKLGCVA